MSYQYAMSETPRRRLVPSLTEIGGYYCPLADLPSPTTEQSSLIPKGNWSQIFQQGYDPTLEEKLERVVSRSMIDGIRIAVWRPGKNLGKDEDGIEMFEQYISNFLHHDTLSEKMMRLRNSHGKKIYRSVTAFLESHPESSVAIWHAIKEQRQTDRFQDDDAEFHLELNNIEWNEDGSRVKEVEKITYTSDSGEQDVSDSSNIVVSHRRVKQAQSTTKAGFHQQGLAAKSTAANVGTNNGDVDMGDVDESTMHDPENEIRPDKKIKKERRPFKLNNTPQTALTVSSSEEDSDLAVNEGNRKGWGLVRMEEHALPGKMGEGVARVQESNILKNVTKRNGRK